MITKEKNGVLNVLFLFIFLFGWVETQLSKTITTSTVPSSSNTVKLTAPTTTTTTKSTGTTQTSDENVCAARNSSCKDCLNAPKAKCLWCGNRCVVYPKSEVLPVGGQCDLKKSKWGTCLVSFFYLLIGMSVVGGLLILGLLICCCCCCCRKNRSSERSWLRMQERFDRERDERQARHSERRADRDRRNDEIRRKYGLVKEDHPYQRFDDK